MINKSVETAEVKVVDAEQGLVEAFVNSMGVVDSDGDIIDPSAFNNSIAKNLPIPVLAGHDQNQIVGKVLSARPVHVNEDEYRLYSLMQFNLETQTGQETFSNVKGNFVNQWSVGFNVPKGGWDFEGEGKSQVRRIKDLDWAEVSSVIRGASPSTNTISAKSADTEIIETTTLDDASVTEDSVTDTLVAEDELLLAKTQLGLLKLKNSRRRSEND